MAQPPLTSFSRLFMKPGDVCEIEVDAIGVLRNGIRDE